MHLQYVDAVDIIRIQEVHVVANYTIDNIQWLCLLVDRSLSTNLNIEACTCAATRLGDVDTWNRTLQRLCKIGSTTSGYLSELTDAIEPVTSRLRIVP